MLLVLLLLFTKNVLFFALNGGFWVLLREAFFYEVLRRNTQYNIQVRTYIIRYKVSFQTTQIDKLLI